MKKLLFPLITRWQIWLCLLITTSAMANKPKIQVSFDIHATSSLNNYFPDDVVTIEEQAHCTLINGLNDYIGFLDFTSVESSHKLEITLRDIKQGINPEYWLYFNLVNLIALKIINMNGNS